MPLLPLLEAEAGIMTRLGSITTGTYFAGSAPRDAVRDRVARVLTANPWLTGTLVKSKEAEHGLAIDYDADIDAEAALARVYDENCALDLGPARSFVDQAVVVGGSSAEVKDGLNLIGKPAEPLCRISLVHAAQSADEAWTDGFCVVVSVTHTIVDGFSYYDLLNMLWDSGTIESQDCKRRFGVAQKIADTLGAAEAAWTASIFKNGLIFNMLGTLMFHKAATPMLLSVDKERVARAKEAAVAASDVPFVSTNDVVTSTFGKMVDAAWVNMAMDLRPRVPEYSGGPSGNYEAVLLMRPADFATPALVRKTLAPNADGLYKRAAVPETAIPAFFETIRGRASIITNWTTNAADDMTLAGHADVLHMPFARLHDKVPFEMAIIFRVRRGESAVVFVSRVLTDKDIEELGHDPAFPFIPYASST